MNAKRWAACVLTGLVLFSGGTEAVLARHVAEERGEQRRQERIERWERDKEILRQREEAEARRAERAAAAEERRAAAERDRAEAERAAREQAEAEAAEERAMAEAEARAEAAARARAEAEAKAAREQAEAEAARAEAEAARQRLEAEAKEQAAREKAEAEARAAQERAAEKYAGTQPEDSVAKAEQGSILGKYLHKQEGKAGDTANKDNAPQKNNQKEEIMKTYIAKNNMELNRLEVTSMDVGGTLLYSDSPEYVRQPGILYSDVVKGDARILYYHLNEMPMACKVAVIIENTSDRYAVVRVNRRGLSEPSDDYLKVGRETQQQYFTAEQPQDSLYIDGHQSRLLSEVMDKTLVMPGKLVYGVYDFSSDVPVRVTVIMYPSAANPLDFVKHAPVLPKDEQRLRGTYTGMDRLMKSRGEYNPGKDGPVYVTIGNTVDDAFKQGIDATDGSLVEDTGNYGVLYHLEVPMKGRKKVQVWVNPMGGVYTGAVRVTTDNPAGTGMYLVPKDAPFFGHVEGASVPLPGQDGSLLITPGTEMFCLGEFKGETLHLEFSPPGASNLPVRFILKEP